MIDAVAPNLAPKGSDMPTLPLHQIPLVVATDENLKRNSKEIT